MKQEFLLPLIATICIIVAKFILAIYLGSKTILQLKERQQRKLTFLSTIFIFIIGLFISRILYAIFDFHLTEFDPARFILAPNLYYWRTATFIVSISGIPVIYSLDRDIYKFKLKLIPVFMLLLVATIQIAYPINSSEDFEFVSTLGIIGSVASMIVPVTFIYLGIKSSGEIRKVSFTLGFSVIAYGIIGMLMSEQILAYIDSAITGGREFVIVFVPIAKIICLSLFSYSAVKFQV